MRSQHLSVGGWKVNPARKGKEAYVSFRWNGWPEGLYKAFAMETLIKLARL